MKKIVMVIVSLLTTFGTFAANAGGTTTGSINYYAGTNCNANSYLDYEYSYTHILNASNTEIHAECPFKTDGAKQAGFWATVWVLDRHPSKDASCLPFSVPVTATDIVDEGRFKTRKPTTGDSTTPQKLTFERVVNDSGWVSSLACYLPRTYNGRKSGVTGYKIEENY